MAQPSDVCCITSGHVNESQSVRYQTGGVCANSFADGKRPMVRSAI